MSGSLLYTSEEMDEATATIAKLEKHLTVLRKNFAAYLAPAYRSDPVGIAKICDEQLDRSGELLGYVREAAAERSGE